jgi:hypothetical protein
MTIRVYDLAVFLFLVGYFFHKPFRELFDSSPYLVKALAWLLVVLFFYYSCASWYHVIKKSMINVLKKEESEALEEENYEEGEYCDFVAGSDEGVESVEETKE